MLPFKDGAFLQAYKWTYATVGLKLASIKERCASLSPYSSIAARDMYHALNHGLTGDAALGEKLAEVEDIQC
jgi:DNA-3-methyladenine glycosylase II